MPYLSAFALTHPDKDHILGFEELLKRVIVGEIWFTPRVFIENDQDLCDDAVAFKDEAMRRVSETIASGGDVVSGDRVRLADAGASEWEIASYLAHTDTTQARAYTRKANRSKLTDSGFEKLRKLSNNSTKLDDKEENPNE